MNNPPKRDTFVTKKIESEIVNLQFKVDTTPRWWFRFVYENMLVKKRAELHVAQVGHYRLSLCYEHRQEQNHSHYATHNCDHCKLMSLAKGNGVNL